ncbi:hypothetical protein [Desulfopila inferna]|uniref:hypothetical protein n=1 Tax=Desulfopila inferna TaxID=468528 RepID=UPI001964A403|nr:hypothetical protein [Desulfopila inferna]MBM9604339.1 hypothetical protein [Desulfopila inferna]
MVAASESRADPVKLTEDAEHHKMEHRLQILSEYEENNETRRFQYVEVEQLDEGFHEEYYELAMNTLKRDRFGE